MGNSSSFNVFENISIIGFKKGKTLQNILVRSSFTKKDFCGPCNKPRYETCKHITKTYESE